MKKEILFVSSSGGHLTQLLQLKSLFNKYESVIITEKNKVTVNLSKDYNVKYLPYATRKKVFSFILKYPIVCFKSLYFLFKYNPKYIITTGAGTALPLCYLGRLFGKKIVYIESFARKNNKSISGRLIYPISSLFIVQWKEMLELYPKAKYYGCIY